MRKFELENLQWADVDRERKRICIRHKPDWSPKSGERDLPMNDRLVTLFTRMQHDVEAAKPRDYVFSVVRSRHSGNWIREQLIKTARKAGIEDLTKLHTLRHTFASHLVMKGVDLPTVQKLMGHSDIQTTMIYAHLAPNHLADAVNKLELA